MKIGICGPVFLPMLRPYLNDDEDVDVKGMGGTPVNHQIIALLEKGYEVHVYSITPELLPGESRVWNGKNFRIYMGPFRRRARHRSPDFFLKERRFMKQSMLDSKPDIIHAHWQYEWGWAAIDSKIPTLLTCHDAPFEVLKAQRDLYRVIRLVMAGICLKKAKHLTAVSPYTASGLRFFTNRPVKVVPNFEPDSVFTLHQSTRTIGENIKIIMINNGFHKRKNVAKGVDAFAEFNKIYPKAELHLYGSCNGKGEDAETYSREKGINANIHFHGEIPFDDLMIALSKTDIFLHTSLEESCPMVLIEAMAMGIPTVAGEKAGGIPWMMADGGGNLTDITDADKILKSLLDLVKPEAYSKASAEARKIAVDRFSKDVVLNKYLEAYNQILA
jgi:glycosyltransferase involved in cell wall biosynthesis